MKKYIIASIIALVAMVTGVNVFHTNSELALSNIALANVEALANNESGDCNYVNGYKKIRIDSNYDGEPRYQYYDCCTKEVRGYEASEPCN